MAKAYIMINCDKGFGEETLKELRRVKHVTAADVVYGVYDIVAVVQAPTMSAVEETIINKIRKVKGVSSTLTMLVAKT
ncbi:MAG: Lrp/AsnC ligand binding domain-containing protein [Thaumarchaeota archaeon]|nr:Lrp/AsnC ligand binding domain-containing protein [Nitrososphaerota archaeon]